MYRVMLADDERWVRRGLIQSIPWEELGLVLAGEAADGQDAYELLLAERPDLLFLDMRMPGLDGKELLALLHAELPELLTIVVSGYSDFEYTQQAIRHHAFDYLLKPVKKEELAAVLEKAVAELARRSDERRRAAAARQDAGWFRDLLLTPPALGDALPEADLPEGWKDRQAVVFAGRPDTYREQAETPDRLTRLREGLERQRPFHLGGHWGCALSPAPDGRAELIGAIAAAELPPAELQRLLAAVQAELQRLDGRSWSLGVSEPMPAAPRTLRRGLEAAWTALASRRLDRREAILSAPEGSMAVSAYPQQREQALLLALELGDRASAERECRLLLETVGGGEATLGQLHQGASALIHALDRQLRGHALSLQDVCGRTSQELTESLRRRSGVGELLDLLVGELIPALLTAQLRSGVSPGARIAEEVRELIERHYDQPLSLPQMAERHHVHPDYLSRLFKRATGYTFVDYLVEIRVRRAIELMQVPSYKNYEIARKVGYEDYRYFSQIFKKKTGQTIGAYRAGLNPGAAVQDSPHHEEEK